MFLLHFINVELSAHILYESVLQGIDSDTRGILLLDQSLETAADYICVGTAAQFLNLAASSGQYPVGTYFLSGEESDIPKLSGFSCNILLSGLSLSPLYNKLFDCICTWKKWTELLNINHDAGLKQLLQRSSRLIDASICIMNSNYKIITASIRQQDSLFFESCDEVPFEAQEIIDCLIRQNKARFAPSYLEERNGYVYCLVPVSVKHEFLGFLYGCIQQNGSLLQSMMFTLAHELSARLQESSTQKSALSFQEIAKLLFLETPPDFEHIQIMLQNLPKPPRKYMRIILVRPDFPLNRDTELKQLYGELKCLFPSHHTALLGDGILILISSRLAACAFPADEDAVEEILERYQATALISHACMSAKSLRISYLKCIKLFSIILNVRSDSFKRLSYFGRYSLYLNIDLCANHMKDDFGSDDIIYLCSPAVLTLTRYDQAFDCNLRDVLFTYLLNGRNIAETSKVMFMHRNTTIYKINKIKELIHHSLDDPYYRFHLIFSCMVIRYYEKHQKHSLNLSPFIRDDYKCY
ncbi:hypothetical protein GPL15_03025 [Clostridium sp. MCC353]|uniref:helix-turn-helix domain-containing protein n=1 Tax=Clostridium sp. MCC353 TaxID=2592646 RepID=UPI001C02B1D7|nr:helix-turn-helix domain-containing protein [Clostridium sp. MCC353]MBT9775481.1 hypothetical protein [Clostridium sp. MCC353]